MIELMLLLIVTDTMPNPLMTCRACNVQLQMLQELNLACSIYLSSSFAM